MKKIQRETMRSLGGELAFFAASNSENGFQSYYHEWFDGKELTDVRVIKGGPGTGKSRLMRDVAECGQRVGWRVELIYCSSDPDSLDGVILKKNDQAIALLDGTAPHVREPHPAGVREHLIDLGLFWDVARLKENGEEINELNTEKKAAYGRAYRYLSAYGEVARNRNERLRSILRADGLERFAERLTKSFTEGSVFSPQTALMRSVGMKGTVWLDACFAAASKRYLIQESHGEGTLLLEEIYRIAAEKRMEVKVSKNPVLSDQLDGLYFPKEGTVFSLCPSELCSYPHHVLHVSRFLMLRGKGELRQRLLFEKRLLRVLLDGARSELETVHLLHGRLEEIYSSAMDFSAKETYTKKLCCELFHLQNL